MATGRGHYVARKFRVLRILKKKGLVYALEDNLPDVTSTASAFTKQIYDNAFNIISVNICNSENSHIQYA